MSRWSESRQLPRNFLVTSWRHARLPRNYSWRLPRNICYGEVMGKLVPVEFEFNGVWKRWWIVDHCGRTTWRTILRLGGFVSASITCSQTLIATKLTSTWRTLSYIQIATVSDRRRFFMIKPIISQLPKLCKRIEYWCIEYLIFILWVRSFSTRLPSVIFAEEKKMCSFSLFSVKNAKIVQLWV